MEASDLADLTSMERALLVLCVQHHNPKSMRVRKTEYQLQQRLSVSDGDLNSALNLLVDVEAVTRDGYGHVSVDRSAVEVVRAHDARKLLDEYLDGNRAGAGGRVGATRAGAGDTDALSVLGDSEAEKLHSRRTSSYSLTDVRSARGDVRDEGAYVERASRRRGRPANPTSPSGLAAHFRDRVRLARQHYGMALGPGATNLRALQGSFARWMREDGLAAEQVQAMVDQFVHKLPAYTDTAQPAWKSFLARREEVWRDVQAREAKQDPEEWAYDLPDAEQAERDAAADGWTYD